MHEMLIILGTLLGCIISYFTINKFVFYTKSEVDAQFTAFKKESDSKDELLTTTIQANHAEIKQELANNKENLFEKLLEAERQSNRDRQQLYDRLAQNKEAFDDYNKTMLSAIAEMKQDEKESNNNFLQLINALKDELKTDYTNRYNELLKIIGTKANLCDFDRLETKFDKVTETITELKTIVQIKLEEGNNKKQLGK